MAFQDGIVVIVWIRRDSLLYAWLREEVKRQAVRTLKVRFSQAFDTNAATVLIICAGPRNEAHESHEAHLSSRLVLVNWCSTG